MVSGDCEAYNVILQLFENQQDPEAVIAMTTSIGHCINLISNNWEVFFDLVSAVLHVPFNSNYEIAATLTDFCTSLASINSNFNKVIFNMLYRELMVLAPTPVVTNQQDVMCSCFLVLFISSPKYSRQIY